MDTALGFLFGSFVLGVWVFAFGYALRHRIKLGNWLNAPDYFDVQIPDRKTALTRHIIKTQWKIDDSRTELSLIELEEKKKAEGTK
jgi:hypothetical protein